MNDKFVPAVAHAAPEEDKTTKPEPAAEPEIEESEMQSPPDDQRSGAKDLVVFSILRESKCADCGEELLGGNFLTMEGERPLCLVCAALGHLVYLPQGDTALTRRARKHSSLSAVVVCFSRGRKRYKRQGVLVEEAALERAEQECLADADRRSAQRDRAEIYRNKQDQALALRMADSIRQMFPGCPAEEAGAIAGAHIGARQRTIGADGRRAGTGRGGVAGSGDRSHSPQAHEIRPASHEGM